MAKNVYLVTGAAGHLGGWVIRRLLSRGQEVRGLLLPGEKLRPDVLAEPTAAQKLQSVVGNVCDPASLDALFAGLEGRAVILHCAGIITIAGRPDERVRSVNVGGTQNVIAACLRHQAQRLVYVSSVHALPVLAAGSVQAEIIHFDAEQVHGAYAKTKAEATQAVLDAAQAGLNAVVVHPSGMLGPYGNPTGNLTRLMNSFLEGRLPLAVKGGFDFVDVRDVAEGVVLAAEKGESGQCYLLTNRYYSVRELLTLLAQVSGRRPTRVYVPCLLARTFAPFAEANDRRKGRPPLFTAYSLDTLSQNALYTHQKAERLLGYTVRPMRDTLCDIAADFDGSNAR